MTYYVNDPKKLFTLEEFIEETVDLDVDDPYGLSTEAFRRCADEIEEYSTKILEKLNL